MDPLDFLREKIPNFQGFDDEGARRLSDELVRAYAGEALADLQQRLGDVAVANERLSKILLRCEFANQIALKQFESAELDETRTERIASADARVIELADNANAVDAASLDGYLQQLEEAFDQRDRAMETARA